MVLGGNNFLPSLPNIYSVTVAGRLALGILGFMPPETEESMSKFVEKLLDIIKSAVA